MKTTCIFLLCFVILYIITILPRFSHRNKLRALHTHMFAHRGYHCVERMIPENSMAAFQAAVDHNYGIELDVHLTKDHKLVVFHDHTLNRMCNRSGIIEQMTVDELKQCRLLGTNESIPLLQDVLDLVDGRVPILIELKLRKNAFLISKKTYDVLKLYHGVYLIQSFHTLSLLWYRLYAPHILRGQLSSRLTKKSSDEPWIAKFAVETLLSNVVGRPDFISYKMADLPLFSVSVLQKVFRTPIAVWTLRTRKALLKGVSHYQIQIFEKQNENY